MKNFGMNFCWVVSKFSLNSTEFFVVFTLKNFLETKREKKFRDLRDPGTSEPEKFLEFESQRYEKFWDEIYMVSEFSSKYDEILRRIYT